MRTFTYTLFMVSALSPFVAAHMEMIRPAPYRSRLNTNVPQANIDYSMTAPLKPDGSNYPCKLYHVDFGTPTGVSMDNVDLGKTSSITIGGSASHGGGSCQISLSFDHGKSFKVIKSFIGNCLRDINYNPDPNQKYEYTVPSDAKSGDAILAWSWFNRSGNREMYMNCVTITISGSGTSTLNSYPDIFKCNIGNGCSILEGIDVVFPNPGNDVTYSQGNHNLGNSTHDPNWAPESDSLPMPEGSQIAVGVFMGLGAAVIVGLAGYYGRTWYKARTMGVGTPIKA